MMTRGAITNLVNRYRAVLSGCRLANLFGTLAVTGILMLGGAGMAEAEYKALTGEQTITGDIAYDGNEERVVYAQGNIAPAGILNFTGDTLSFKTTTDTTNPARIMMAAGFSPSIVPEINIGSKDRYATSVTLQVSNSGNANPVNAYGDGGDANDVNGGVINIYADTLSVNAVSTQGGAYGLFVQNRTDSATGSAAAINIHAGQAFIDVHSDLSDSAYALVGMSQGQITIEGDLYVNTRGGTGAVLTTRGDAVININTEATGTVQMNGDVVFEYVESSDAAVDSTVNISLTDSDSWWQGNTRLIWWADNPVDPSKLEVHGMTLNLANGATWIPTPTKADNPAEVLEGSAYTPLNNLNLDNGIVNLNPGINITVENLNGTGTVNMAVNPGAPEEAGTLTAEQAKNASLNVNLTGVTADDLTTGQAVSLVQGVSSTDGQLVVTGAVAEGLVNGALLIDADGTATMRTNKVMEAALETASVSSIALDRILTNDLRKRMGDLRSANGEHGLWVRWDGGSLKGDSGLTNNFNTIQIGADTAAGRNVRLGLAASFTHGDIDNSRGSSEMEGVALAGYGVWMAENGLYADVVGRIGTFRTDMDVDEHEGTLESLVASLSGEVGWRFDLNELFYLEPQAELAYTYIEGDRFGLGSARYETDDTDSLIGHAGLAAGFKLPNDRGDIYARASVVQQFMGDAKISGRNNGMLNTFKLDGDDTWVEYGIGANVRLTDAVYAWVDVERTDGATIDEEWRGTVGLRYSF